MSEKKKAKSKDMDPKALRKELEESQRKLESLQQEKDELFDKLQRRRKLRLLEIWICLSMIACRQIGNAFGSECACEQSPLHRAVDNHADIVLFTIP